MSKLNISRLTNENEDGAPKISGISTFSSNAFLEVPKGSTAERPEYVSPGMIRFNTDSGHLEYYNGVEWTEVLVKETAGISGRGIFAGGNTPTIVNTIDYVTITTTGNASDFGDLSVVRDVASGCSSKTRGIIAGGYSGSELSSIDYIEIASLGNAQNFGNLVSTRRNRDGCGDSTRGIMMGGWAPTAAIDIVTYSSTGSATTGGSLIAARYNTGALSSSTRGIVGGGDGTSPAGNQNIMEYVTIQSLGTAQDFGDLTQISGWTSGTSSSTRGIFVLDNTTINYITISSTGNAQDFGDSYNANNKTTTGNGTRAVIAGGFTPAKVNTIEFITISTLGNSIEFGDLNQSISHQAALSNGHGGL